MDDQPTCGKGLAEHSTLPAKLGELMDGLAGVLEVHMESLDLSDESSRREHRAYMELATQYRNIAGQLSDVARRMAGYRDLPMGAHDMNALSGPEPREAFEEFVRLEAELHAMLAAGRERDRAMLEDMRSPAQNRS